MSDDTDLVAEIEKLGERLALAKASIGKRFIGQPRVVDLTLSALLCGGHGLLVGLPGLGKTRLVDTVNGDGHEWAAHSVYAGLDARGYSGLGSFGNRR